MPEVWPFRPLKLAYEQLGWRTDVNRTGNSEVRIAGRPARQSMVYSYSIRDPRMAEMERLIKAFPTTDWLVPVWWERTEAQAVSAAQDEFAVDWTEEYANVIVWAGCARFAVAEVYAYTMTGIQLAAPIGQDFDKAVIIPLRTCIAPFGISGVAITKGTFTKPGANNATISFLSREPMPEIAWTGAEFQSLPLIRVCDFSLPLAYQVIPSINLVDSELGQVDPELFRSQVVSRYSMNFTKVRDQVRTLNDFLLACHGKDNPFWISGWGNEFVLAVAATSAATSIDIRPAFGSLPAYVGRHLCLDDGTQTVRTITAATQVGDFHRLSFSGALGRDIPRARGSFLRKVRLDADQVEIEHVEGFSARVTVPLVEIPE
jgi:hypothetical protein